MATPPLELHSGMRTLGWLGWDLWVAAMPIGGHFTLDDINRILSGHLTPTRGQYNVLAATLNEHINEQGGNHPIRLRTSDHEPA
jgi:hypothetical protein